ncbi:MAG: hypothetical protein KDB03_27370, partial [Planctomycetales bacterium]|nr:hypothetical protein [Planctomycetales bacterium]
NDSEQQKLRYRYLKYPEHFFFFCREACWLFSEKGDASWIEEIAREYVPAWIARLLARTHSGLGRLVSARMHWHSQFHSTPLSL